MIPIMQRNRHEPENKIYGDCHRACMASLLEMPYEFVPHFAEGWVSEGIFQKRVDSFLLRHGYIQVNIAFDPPLENIFVMMRNLNEDIYYILGGLSKNGCNHSVIACNDKIVHDPSLDASGIVGPTEQGYYWITIIGPAILRK